MISLDVPVNMSRADVAHIIRNDDERHLLCAHKAFVDARADEGFQLSRLYASPVRPVAPSDAIGLRGRSLDWCVAAFTLLLCFGEMDDRLYAHLRSSARSGRYPDTLFTRMDFLWFLFSEKDWGTIATILVDTDWSEIPDGLRWHLCDLAMMSFYRTSMPHILAGQDVDGFKSRIADFEAGTLAKLQPDSDRMDFYHACFSHILGDFDGARRAFVTAAHRLETSLALRAVGSVLPDVNHPHQGSDSWDRCAVQQHHSGEDVFLISLDAGYFDTYFEAFLARLADTNPALPLHVHAIGFDPEDRLRQLGVSDRVGYTCDITDLSAFAGYNRKTYFACARLMYLRRYLDIYKSVYICDVDGAIRNPLDRLASHSDVSVQLLGRLIARPQKLFRLPWECFGAGNVYVKSTDFGYQFAEFVAQYLSHIVFDPDHADRFTWYADQNALFYAWLTLRGAGDIGSIPFEMFKQADEMRTFFRADVKKTFMVS